MRKLTYLAVFEPTETGYSVYFPDLLGCVSYGEDFEGAQRQAAEALALHIYGMEKDSYAPSPIIHFCPIKSPSFTKNYN